MVIVIFPLHGVTGAMRRHEGAGPLVGVRDKQVMHDFEFPPSPPTSHRQNSGFSGLPKIR